MMTKKEMIMMKKAMMRTMMAMINIVKVTVEEIPVEYAWVEKQPESRY